MDAITSDAIVEEHKRKIKNPISGIYCAKEEAGVAEHLKYLEKHLGHDLLITLIIYLSKSHGKNNYLPNIPALQLEKFEKDEKLQN